MWGYLTDSADLSQLADHFGLTPAVPEPPKTGFLVGFLPSQGGSGASTVCLHVAQKIAGGSPGLIGYSPVDISYDNFKITPNQ